MPTRSKVSKAFGKILREHRRARGLSQEDLAAGGEFDRTYPSLLERGLRSPTLTILFYISKKLEVRADQLVEETEKELNRT